MRSLLLRHRPFEALAVKLVLRSIEEGAPKNQSQRSFTHCIAVNIPQENNQREEGEEEPTTYQQSIAPTSSYLHARPASAIAAFQQMRAAANKQEEAHKTQSQDKCGQHDGGQKGARAVITAAGRFCRMTSQGLTSGRLAGDSISLIY